MAATGFSSFKKWGTTPRNFSLRRGKSRARPPAATQGAVASALGSSKGAVEAEILRRAATGDHQGVVALGLGLIEGRVQGEVVASLLGVGLIALEIMDRGANLLPRLLPRAYRMNRVADGQQRLERHHHLVVF